MRQDEIQVFVDGLMSYYTVITKRAPVIGSPYLVDDPSSGFLEYAGLIGITGRYSGSVIFTAPKSMLMLLLSRYNGSEYSSDLLLDLVGEIANTISGNAREKLGPDFVLSPPTVTHGKFSDIPSSKGLQTYCIPIDWHNRKANLVVALA
jgi:chemotaxis protein CheX